MEIERLSVEEMNLGARERSRILALITPWLQVVPLWKLQFLEEYIKEHLSYEVCTD